MTFEEACAYLIKKQAVKTDGGLHSLSWYISWSDDGSGKFEGPFILDGEFTVEDLEAFVAYAKGIKEQRS